MIGVSTARKTVGNFFETQFAKRLDLIRTDKLQTGKNVDLISKTGDLLVESKGSAYDSGGVIREGQLTKNLTYNLPMFYGVGYHSLSCKRTRPLGKYPSVRALKRKLDVRGLYLLPVEVIKLYFHSRGKIPDGRTNDNFVLLREGGMKKIIDGENEMWDNLQLDFSEFETTVINEVIKLSRFR